MSLLRVVIRKLHSKSPGLVNFNQLNLKSAQKVKVTKSSLHDLLISMPKDPVHIPPLKTGRTVRKELLSKFPAGYIRLEVLGNGAKGAPASLYLFTDQTRYLFNCGEGTQRLAHEHKMKLAKLEHVFVTNSIWKQIGGIPGVALTIQDIGVPTITLHGPPGLENLFEGTRRFVILKDLKISVPNSEAKYFEDHVMRIDYVPLEPIQKQSESSTHQTSEQLSKGKEQIEEVDEIDYYAPIKGLKRNLEIEGHNSMGKKLKVSDNEGPSNHVYCYICRPTPKAGALLIQKCIDQGVPTGPLLGQLKKGEDITLPDGRIVKASSVCSPDAPATVFIIVDCPSEDYLDPLVNNTEFRKYQGDDVSQNDFVHVLVHFTPKHILTHPVYIAWMQKFTMSTQHLMLNELCEGMGSEAVHRAQFQLNIIDQGLFPLLKDNSTVIGEDIRKEVAASVQRPLLYGATQLRYNLRPDIGLDLSAQVTVNGEEFVKDLLQIPDFKNSLEQLKGQLSNHKCATTGSPGAGTEFPKFTFLGTGSCIPNKTRNVSGILLGISSNSSMLLDCGEGTYGQLVRLFGPEVENILVNLTGIYISHLHADHHLGLINLLQERYGAFIKNNVPFRPVFIIGPHQIESWLHLYHRKFQPLSHLYQIVANASILHPEASLDPVLETQLYETTGLAKMQTVPVRHCPNSYGVALTGQSGWKVTYSGDTMPCDALVTLGRNSDLLIHEATMEDELKDEAVIKMHSTMSEAIEMGKKMNAKFTMLTHFSQRYAKVPKISGDLEGSVGIAFDNMTLGLNDLWKVPLMYPTFKTMFAEYYEDMETKTAKKLRRKERERAAQLV